MNIKITTNTVWEDETCLINEKTISFPGVGTELRIF